jgi:hypothetical protein
VQLVRPQVAVWEPIQQAQVLRPVLLVHWAVRWARLWVSVVVVLVVPHWAQLLVARQVQQSAKPNKTVVNQFWLHNSQKLV